MRVVIRDHVLKLRRSILACQLTHEEAQFLIDTIQTRVWDDHPSVTEEIEDPFVGVDGTIRSGKSALDIALDWKLRGL